MAEAEIKSWQRTYAQGPKTEFLMTGSRLPNGKVRVYASRKVPEGLEFGQSELRGQVHWHIETDCTELRIIDGADWNECLAKLFTAWANEDAEEARLAEIEATRQRITSRPHRGQPPASQLRGRDTGGRELTGSPAAISESGPEPVTGQLISPEKHLCRDPYAHMGIPPIGMTCYNPSHWTEPELRTKSGVILTDADIERLADEAEAGYDIPAPGRERKEDDHGTG